jgi:hypothetical protein
MEIPKPEHTGITFERRYGSRHIELPDGRTVTSMSDPSWDEFAMSFIDLEVQGGPGDYIITPELITSAEFAPAETAEAMHVVHERTGLAQRLTTLYPETTLLLGTAVVDPAYAKPRNAILFLQNGEEVGRTYKTPTLNRAESLAFHQPEYPQLARPEPGIMPIICSDLVSNPRVDAHVHTLLVSACWGAPAGYPGVLASPESRHLQLLADITADLFTSNPRLRTIVMADRVPPTGVSASPFNFVARPSAR